MASAGLGAGKSSLTMKMEIYQTRYRQTRKMISVNMSRSPWIGRQMLTS